MSARDSARRTKASQHPDLFIPQSERSEVTERNFRDQDEIEDDFSPLIQDQQLHDTYGAGAISDDPLQLEHVVGFGADSQSNLLCLPLNEYSIVKGLGNLITIENINDPHDQKFLRAHDMPVNVLAVSPSGELLASGQYGTTRFKGNAAPVFIWSTLTGRRLAALRGITQRVNLLQFSTDEKFLCGCGDDCLLYVWELVSGEVVYVQRFTYPVCIMSWITHTLENRRTVYDLALGVGTTLSKGKFYFDQGRVQWTLSLKPYSLPSGGLVRQFASVIASDDCQYLYVGSTGSDLIVYRHDIAVYRALIPICSNGIRSIAKLSNGDLLCGGGDGTLTKIRGNDLMWEVIQKIQLNGSILSLSLTSSQSEVLAGCSSGAIYRCMTHSLTSQLITTAHTSPITCIKFGSSHNLNEGKNSDDDEDRTGYFATGTLSGELRVWDIADYTCLGYYKETKSFSTSSLSGGDGVGNSVLSISLYGSNNSHIISGWKDGSVKCHDITLQRMIWSIPQAHRDGVTSIAVCSKLFHFNNNNNNNNNQNNQGQRSSRGYSSAGRGNNNNNNNNGEGGIEYMVTGGKDGAIRIWRLSSRELITQYTEHTKSISTVLIDLNFPNLIHSTSHDGTVISYDLQANHRKISHIMKGSTHGSSGGSITSMTQRHDSENEVVTCDSQGRIITWDIDIRDPVQVIQDIGYNPSLTCCMISPISGKYLAFAGEDSVLKILDIRRNEIISLGRGHTDGITSLSWTSDEKQIITVGKDNCMCVWNFYLGGER